MSSLSMSDPGVAYGGAAASGALAPLKSQILAALKSPDAKSMVGMPMGGGSSDVAVAASSILGSFTAALARQPNLVPQLQANIQKAYTAPLLQDSSQILDKSWWNDVFRVVQQAAPVAMQIIGAVSGGKDFNTVVKSPAAQRHANDPDWQNFVADLLTQVTPMFVHALRGTKDFSQPGAATLDIRVPANIQGDRKGWFDDAISFISDAAPVVLPIAMSLL